MGLARLDLARQAGITQFGGPVTYQPAAGGSFEVEGVYSAPHEAVDIGTASISTVAPVLGVELGDFASAPKRGDTLVRGGVTYRVDDVQEDGEGGADLVLHRIS